MVVILGLVLFFHQKKTDQTADLPVAPVDTNLKPVIPYDRSVPAPPAPKPSLTFGGYPCNGDCSGHQAGYRQAEKDGITDPDSCTGSSAAAIEGCRVYASQRSGKAWDK